jgi:hypothetical protein
MGFPKYQKIGPKKDLLLAGTAGSLWLGSACSDVGGSGVPAAQYEGNDHTCDRGH